LAKKNYSKLRILSIVVISYMLLALAWWSYLLYIKNNDAYQAKLELLKITKAAQSYPEVPADFKLDSDFIELSQNYKSQERMILSEAIVLAISLIIGIWFINRGYQRQTEAARQSRNFLLSITHELKSPIASIRLILQTFTKRKLEQNQINTFSKNALQETERLESLVNNLLLAAKLETTQVDIQAEDIELYPMLDGIRESIYNKNPEAKITLEVQHDTMIQADKKAMLSVFINLIENAVKYSGKESQIHIKYQEKRNTKLITIADNGWGIPDKEKNKVFQKFYRIGNEDTRTTKGTGLGLYIVQQIIEAQQGKITIKDNIPKGTIFEIELFNKKFKQ